MLIRRGYWKYKRGFILFELSQRRSVKLNEKKPVINEDKE
jgi:hypothetical protein